MEEDAEIKILSIDAWRDGDGWTWNDHRKAGTIDPETLATLSTARRLLAWLRAKGYLSGASKGRVRVDEPECYEGVFIEIQAKGTGKPILAISGIH